MTLINTQKLNAKEKLIIMSGIFLLLFAFIFYITIFLSIKKINQLNEEIIGQKIEIQQGLEDERNMNELREKLKIVEPQMEKLEQIFINENRELEFITTLESVAKKNNIEQKISLGVIQITSNLSYKKMPINITVTGKFYNVINYLTELEKLQYYISINTIDISSSPNKQITENIEENIVIRITADTYWK